MTMYSPDHPNNAPKIASPAVKYLRYRTTKTKRGKQSVIMIRLPVALHEEAKKAANDREMSLNQFMIELLTTTLGAHHNARETLKRWGVAEADTCIDPVLAVCAIADRPHGPVDLTAAIKDFLEWRGGTQG